VPRQSAGFGFDSENAGDEQTVAARWIAHARIVRSGIARTDIEQIELRVVREGVPGRAAAADRPVAVRVPRRRGHLEFRMFESFLRIAGYDIEAPGEFAGLGIVGREKATHSKVGTAIADDHLTLHHTRCTRDGVVGLTVGRVSAPQFLSGARVERDQPAIERPDIDFTLPERHAAIHRLTAAITQPFPGDTRIVCPHALAAASVEGEHAAPTRAHVQHAVRHDGGGFDAEARAFQIRFPCKAESRDVTCVDAIQWRVALFAVAASVAEPVVGVLIEEPDSSAVDVLQLQVHRIRCIGAASGQKRQTGCKHGLRSDAHQSKRGGHVRLNCSAMRAPPYSPADTRFNLEKRHP